jgi:predicted Rdx family selenoprotein
MTKATLKATVHTAANDSFVTSAQVRARYSVSDMWIWRRQRDGSGFPAPMIVNKRKFWRVADLVDWERAKTEASRNQANDTADEAAVRDGE